MTDMPQDLFFFSIFLPSLMANISNLLQFTCSIHLMFW